MLGERNLSSILPFGPKLTCRPLIMQPLVLLSYQLGHSTCSISSMAGETFQKFTTKYHDLVDTSQCTVACLLTPCPFGFLYLILLQYTSRHKVHVSVAWQTQQLRGWDVSKLLTRVLRRESTHKMTRETNLPPFFKQENDNEETVFLLHCLLRHRPYPNTILRLIFPT